MMETNGMMATDEIHSHVFSYCGATSQNRYENGYEAWDIFDIPSTWYHTDCKTTTIPMKIEENTPKKKHGDQKGI
jgi:hypothetical protein